MQPFEDILYEEDERAITGFINSSGDLEYTIYDCADGGFIDLENKEYSKDELTDLLIEELDFFVNRMEPAVIIRGDSFTINFQHYKPKNLHDVALKLDEVTKSLFENKTVSIFLKSPGWIWKIID